MNYGTAYGLAVPMQWDQRINDLRYRDQADRQAAAFADEQKRRQLADQEASAKLISDGIEFAEANNPYDAQKLKEYTDREIRSLGNYYSSHPNAKYDPTALLEIKKRKQSIKDNEISRRAIATDTARKEFLKDWAEAVKNPEAWDMEAMQEQHNKLFTNYNQYGHPDGLAGIERDGKEQAAIYSRPQNFIDENKLYLEVAPKIQAKGIENLKNGMRGGFKSYALDEDVRPLAESIYNNHKRQYDVRYTRQGIDPVKAIMESLKPLVPTEYEHGKPDDLWQQKELIRFQHKMQEIQARKAGNPTDGSSAYDISILNTDQVAPGAEMLAETFTSTPPNFYKGPDGRMVPNTTNDFHYDGYLAEKGVGSKNYKRTGIKNAPGFFYQSLDWGDEQGYLSDPWGPSGSNGTDLVVKPEFKDWVEIVNAPPDKDGNTRKMLKVKSIAEINANTPLFRNRFDSNVAKLTTNQRDAAGVEKNTLENGNAGSYEGHPVGSIVKTSAGNYLVTKSGYIKQ